MAVHRGPGMRTARTRALEIGTDPKGFDGAIPYDEEAQQPRLPSVAPGAYKAQEPALTSGGMTPIQRNPIKLK